jgi:SOS-response transcriptional repressor LexA
MATATKRRYNTRVTPLQALVYRFMLRYQAKHGCPPTFWEIATGLDLGTINSAICHLRALTLKGMVKEVLPKGRHRRYVAIPKD